MNNRPNTIYLSPDCWIVKSQAGFRKIVKQFLKEEGGDEDYSDVLGYPKTYPSLVFLRRHYNGGCFLTIASCIPVSTLKSKLSLLNNSSGNTQQ